MLSNLDDCEPEAGAGWYRRHTAVVAVLAVSTSMFVGVAAAGGISVLSTAEEVSSVVAVPEPVSEPPVVIEVDPVPAPEPNPAARAPESLMAVPPVSQGTKWRVTSVSSDSDLDTSPGWPSDPPPEHGGEDPPPDPVPPWPWGDCLDEVMSGIADAIDDEVAHSGWPDPPWLLERH